MLLVDGADAYYSEISGLGKLKPITDPIQRFDGRFPWARLLQLAPQVADMAVHRAVGDHAVVGVDLVEQLVA